MTRFSGKYDYSLDDKGRINFKKLLNRLPEDERGCQNYHVLKQQLKSNHGKEDRYPLFYLFTENAWNKYYDLKKIDDMATATRMSFLSLCGECSLDSAERLSFPKELLKFIGADKELILQGDGEKIQVWSKTVYDKYMSELGQPDDALMDIFS